MTATWSTIANLKGATGAAGSGSPATPGTAAAPGYAFQGQTDTGHYLSTASSTAAIMSASVNGSEVLRYTKGYVYALVPLYGTVVQATNNGTLAAPSVGFSNQPDSGLYLATQSASAAQVTMVVNGVSIFDMLKTMVLVNVPAFLQKAVQTAATVTSTTPAGTPSFVSSQGFKQNITATFWNSTYTANSAAQMQLPVVNNGNNSVVGSTPFVYVFPAAGSVLAMNFNQAGPIGGSNSFSVYKNGASILTYTPGSSTTGASPIYAKGTYGFARNDTLTIFYVNTSAGNTQVQLHVTIEMGA